MKTPEHIAVLAGAPLASSEIKSASASPLSAASITSPSAASNPLFIRVSVPSAGIQKTLRAAPHELVWQLKRQIIDKVGADIKDVLNHGLFLAPSGGKLGKFLDEKRDLGSYQLESNCLVEFIPKKRINVTLSADGEGAPTPKNHKRFMEDVAKGNVEKVRERGSKGMDPNFLWENGDTPLSVAVANNDKETVLALIENGAFLDFRVGEKDVWKTPLHLAAAHNKLGPLQVLLSYGAWVNSPDILNMTPLYYAATAGHSECVEKLLLNKADMDVYDESGKGPLHQACLNNFEQVVGLLIDFGANMDVTNVAGNTPLHIAATRNATECARWLLIRGADREKTNKSGQTAQQVAAMSGSNDVVELIKKFTPDQIIPPPPRMEDAQINQFSSRTNLPSSFSHLSLRKIDHNRAHSESVRSTTEIVGAHTRSATELANPLQNRRLSALNPAAAIINSSMPSTPDISISRGRGGLETPDSDTINMVKKSGSMQSLTTTPIQSKAPNRRSKIPGPPPGPRPTSIPTPEYSRPASLDGNNKKIKANGSLYPEGAGHSADGMGKASSTSILSLSSSDTPMVLVNRIKSMIEGGADNTEVLLELDHLANAIASFDAQFSRT
ncbi:hypothetical protein HDU76_011467 [Blyttiomyces sp. JEL0837]|nr:hypothetical protein HDU76_011467 [Blyttiomyces sp. JEL0837]